MHKNGTVVTMEQCELIMMRYNGYGDGRVSLGEFWEIFKPKKLAMVDDIVKIRKTKSVMPGNPATNILLREKITQILLKTI